LTILVTQLDNISDSLTTLVTQLDYISDTAWVH